PAAIARLGFGKSAAMHQNSMHQDSTGDNSPSLAPGAILRLVQAVIRTRLRRGLVLTLTTLLTLGAAWYLMPPAEYLPEGEEPKAFSSMIAPPGYNLSEMAEIAKEIRSYLTAEVKADPALFDRGETSMPSLQYYSLSVSV